MSSLFKIFHISGKDSTKKVRKRIVRYLCEPRSRDSGHMPAPEQGLWADACPGAGTLGISLRVDSRSWPQSTLGFGKPPVILAILASAFVIQNTTIFKYPIEHVHIFFCLTVSQIQQALRRLKKAIISIL